MNKGKLWTKDFIIVSAINFLIALIFYLLMVTIASYATNEFHASTSVAGLSAGIFIIGALIGRLGIGSIIEDIGSKRILSIGLIFFIITSALYFGAIHLSLLITTRLLHGIAFGVVTTATGTIIAQIIPHNRHGEGIGFYTMSTVLGMALGPFVGILLSRHANFMTVFIFTFVLAVVCLPISFVVNDPALKSYNQHQASAVKSFQISNFIEFRSIAISIIGLIICFCYSGIMAFISLYSKEIHLIKAASMFFLVSAITTLVSRPFSGRLLDAKGANIVMYPCIFIFAIAMLLLSQTNQGITLLLAGALTGLGYGNFLSCAQAIAIKAVPHHRLGLATSTFFIFLDLGFGVGPYLFGFILPFTGYRGLYLMMVFVILATIILYQFLHGRKPPQMHRRPL